MSQRQADYGSPLERTLETHMRAYGIDGYEMEYRFHPVRRWRFDFAFPDKMIAVECEGGTYSHGRHVRPGGVAKDTEKYNAATMLGWRVLRYTSGQITSGEAVRQIAEVVG